MLYNPKEKKYIHVGSECLTYFTGGLNADSISSYYDTMGMIEQDNTDYEGMILDQDDEMFNAIMNSTVSVPTACKTESLLYFANEMISDKNYNYVKGNAFSQYDEGSTAYQAYYKALNDESKSIPSDVKEKFKLFIESKLDIEGGSYWNNVLTLLGHEWTEQKYVAFLTSALHIFYVNKWKAERNKTAPSSEWVGSVGEKITFTIKDAHLLYIGDNEWGSFYVYSLIDDNGNTLIWRSSNHFEIDELVGHAFKATIKSLDTYKGVKQTIITRAKQVN